MKREMVIQIAPDGSISLEVKGVKGGECIDFSKFLEEALGDVIQREKTSEFYQEAPRGEVSTRQGE
jgi:Protein of unknown function (DUF2997)